VRRYIWVNPNVLERYAPALHKMLAYTYEWDHCVHAIEPGAYTPRAASERIKMSEIRPAMPHFIIYVHANEGRRS